MTHPSEPINIRQTFYCRLSTPERKINQLINHPVRISELQHHLLRHLLQCGADLKWLMKILQSWAELEGATEENERKTLNSITTIKSTLAVCFFPWKIFPIFTQIQFRCVKAEKEGKTMLLREKWKLHRHCWCFWRKQIEIGNENEMSFFMFWGKSRKIFENMKKKKIMKENCENQIEWKHGKLVQTLNSDQEMFIQKLCKMLNTHCKIIMTNLFPSSTQSPSNN